MNGFWMISASPLAKRPRSAASSVWPVMKSTFTPGCSSESVAASSAPFIRGITTSVRSTSTRPPRARTASSASAPLRPATTS